jgi:hypothetical protein
MSSFGNYMSSNLSFSKYVPFLKMEGQLTFYPKSSQRIDTELVPFLRKRINSFLLNIKAPVTEEFNISTYRSGESIFYILRKQGDGAAL